MDTSSNSTTEATGSHRDQQHDEEMNINTENLGK